MGRKPISATPEDVAAELKAATAKIEDLKAAGWKIKRQIADLRTKQTRLRKRLAE